MSDIFISYASADRERARVFAEVLAEQGWSVWWDRVIPPGKQFDEVIEEALDGAKCVVVLWSQASAASTWVKTEAAEAMRRKALIPVIIEDVKIPLEFRRLQAADLSRWTGDRTDPQLAQFFESIAAEVQRSGVPTNAGAAPAVERPPQVEAPSLPIAPAREPPAAGVARKRSPALIGIVAAAVVVLLSAGLYYEHAKSVALAEEAQRMKAAQEETERERTARENAGRLATAEDGRRSRVQPPVARAHTAPAARVPQAVPASGVLNLQWRDHVLGYSGNLSWSPSSALFEVSVVDLNSGARLGNYAVPAMVSRQGPMEYVVSAQFAIPGDSTTPGPHTHLSRLLLRAQTDGSLHFLQNCPRPGECY